MGFCMGFLIGQSSGNKSKNPLSLAGQRVPVELLGGFEPPTSSLPIIARPIVACCFLLQFILSIPCGTGATQFSLVVVCCALRLLYLNPFSV